MDSITDSITSIKLEILSNKAYKNKRKIDIHININGNTIKIVLPVVLLVQKLEIQSENTKNIKLSNKKIK